MSRVPKCELFCIICDEILNDPIHLPCHCTICKVHLSDDSVSSRGIITCKSCGDEFVVKNIKPMVNRHAKIHLDTEGYLSDEEKALKSHISDLFAQYHQLYEKYRRRTTGLEINSHEIFAEIKSRIDIHREELKSKIDEIALGMIKKVKEYEHAFYKRLNERAGITDLNINAQKSGLDEEFRQLNINMERVRQLETQNEANIQRLQSKMDDLTFMATQLGKSSFEPNKDVKSAAFGVLTLPILAK